MKNVRPGPDSSRTIWLAGPLLPDKRIHDVYKYVWLETNHPDVGRRRLAVDEPTLTVMAWPRVAVFVLPWKNNVFQHGGDWERSLLQGPKRRFNAVATYDLSMRSWNVTDPNQPIIDLINLDQVFR